MRVLLFLFVMPVWGQQARLPFVGRAPVTRPSPVHRSGVGYWGGGYWGASGPVAAPAPVAVAPAAPVLVSSSLYQADRGEPVLREYGVLPAPAVAASAVVAFKDGRVEPVLAYWVAGDELVYVAVGDVVRRVAVTTVDVGRSEGLNRQSGVVFRLK